MSPDARPSPRSDPQAIWREGGLALREGRPDTALGCFQSLLDMGQEAPAIWLGVALAHRALGDQAAKRAALDRVLALDPRDMRALLMVADHNAEAGDARAASAYYQAAIRLADAGGPLPDDLAADIRHARAAQAGLAKDFETHLQDRLVRQGLDDPSARRVRSAVDLLLGRSEIYLQQPKHFYFPELPNIHFAERADFPWLDRVEAATDAIRVELLEVLKDQAAFTPYIQAEPDRPFFDDHGLRDNPDWSACYLWRNGEPVPDVIARCPRTAEALAEAPLCRIPGRSPSIFFSLLRPGAHIPPHHGFMNARYICHLPLIVPENCAMRVGAETRPWVEGKACVFDDSIEHEAWNRSTRLRVVLIFDVWRPELSEIERTLVSGALEAVDAYGAEPAPAWE